MAECSIVNKFVGMPDLGKLPPNREWVYFVEGHFSQALIKIGHTRSLKSRLMQLQVGIPTQLKLLGAVNAPAGSEFLLHRIFEEYRVHNEWFEPSAELLAVIRSLPKGGKIDGIDLLKIGRHRGLDEKRMRMLLWSGTRRVARGMGVPGASKRKRPVELLIVNGFDLC